MSANEKCRKDCWSKVQARAAFPASVSWRCHVCDRQSKVMGHVQVSVKPSRNTKQLEISQPHAKLALVEELFARSTQEPFLCLECILLPAGRVLWLESHQSLGSIGQTATPQRAEVPTCCCPGPASRSTTCCASTTESKSATMTDPLLLLHCP